MSIEVMRQALEVLEQINQLSIGENAIALPGEIDAAMDNLRAAIEQAEKPKYRRGTYVRCMESDELCRVWTTSIDGGAWVKWPDGSITTYTAEQMGQAFSLEQTAPGKPAGYLSKGELFYPLEIINRGVGDAVPLYEHPRQWVGLTDEEIAEEFYKFEAASAGYQIARAIEAKLKEKNAA